MDKILVGQIAFLIYCFIIPFLLVLIGIGIAYIKINNNGEKK